MEAGGRHATEGRTIISEFVWKHCGQPRKNKNRKVGIPAEISAEKQPNTILKPHRA
jgi:hypothetical protein